MKAQESRLLEWKSNVSGGLHEEILSDPFNVLDIKVSNYNMGITDKWFLFKFDHSLSVGGGWIVLDTSNDIEALKRKGEATYEKQVAHIASNMKRDLERHTLFMTREVAQMERWLFLRRDN